MPIYIYIYMCVCVCVCVCVYVHAWLFVHECVHAILHIYEKKEWNNLPGMRILCALQYISPHTHTRARTHTHTHIYIYAYVCVCVCVCVCACTNILYLCLFNEKQKHCLFKVETHEWSSLGVVIEINVTKWLQSAVEVCFCFTQSFLSKFHCTFSHLFLHFVASLQSCQLLTKNRCLQVILLAHVFISLSLSLSLSAHTHTHTHKHTQRYICKRNKEKYTSVNMLSSYLEEVFTQRGRKWIFGACADTRF